MNDFEFRLYTVPDNLYGVEDPETGEWNGIVRQLMERRADMAGLITVAAFEIPNQNSYSFYIYRLLNYVKMEQNPNGCRNIANKLVMKL